MLNWLSKLFRRPQEAPLRRHPASPIKIVHDERLISVDDGKGGVATLLWADLASVTVLTTDRGPFEADLFWVLSDRDGRRTLTIPMDAEGEHTLLQAMQARLSGFDNMAVVEAMSSTTHGEFRVWPPVATL